MHSLAMAENLLKAIVAEAEKHNGKRIESVRIKLDTHDFSEADSLQFCFQAVAVGTIAEGARLEINKLMCASGEDPPYIEFEMA